jgi:hypothetical protein
MKNFGKEDLFFPFQEYLLMTFCKKIKLISDLFVQIQEVFKLKKR